MKLEEQMECVDVIISASRMVQEYALKAKSMEERRFLIRAAARIAHEAEAVSMLPEEYEALDKANVVKGEFKPAKAGKPERPRYAE